MLINIQIETPAGEKVNFSIDFEKKVIQHKGAINLVHYKEIEAHLRDEAMTNGAWKQFSFKTHENECECVCNRDINNNQDKDNQ